jgi:hypothetical protein
VQSPADGHSPSEASKTIPPMNCNASFTGCITQAPKQAHSRLIGLHDLPVCNSRKETMRVEGGESTVNA